MGTVLLLSGSSGNGDTDRPANNKLPGQAGYKGNCNQEKLTVTYNLNSIYSSNPVYRRIYIL